MDEATKQIEIMSAVTAIKVVNAIQDNINQPRLLHGIQAMADYLGRSRKTIQNYKKNMAIPYKQVGRTIIFDVDQVLKAIEKRGQNDK